MRALVTGGAGFIGSHVVDRFLASGHEVRVLDDLSSGSSENLGDAATLFRAGLGDADMLHAAVEGVEVVVHLGARRAVLQSVEDPLTTDAVNVHGTLALLQAAHTAGVRRVISASSSSVYGGAEGAVREEAPTRPRSPYAVSKLAAEHYCRVYRELHGLETVSFRLFNVYGPRQRPDSAYAAVIPLFIDALRRGTAPTVHGDGCQSRDFTYVSDVVDAIVTVAEAHAVPPQPVYNIAGGSPHSLLELLAVLGRLLAVDPAPVHTDPRPGDIRHSCADVSSARRDLGVTCRVPFEEGLARTVAWFTGR